MTRFVQLLFTFLEIMIPDQEQGEDNLSYLFLFFFFPQVTCHVTLPSAAK